MASAMSTRRSRPPAKTESPTVGQETPARDGDSSSPRRPSPRKPTEQPAGETGGPKGPEPTRYGDWQRGGRVTDF